jgi:hypothetical protein
MIDPANDTTIALPAKSSNYGLIAAMSHLIFEHASNACTEPSRCKPRPTEVKQSVTSPFLNPRSASTARGLFQPVCWQGGQFQEAKSQKMNL